MPYVGGTGRSELLNMEVLPVPDWNGFFGPLLPGKSSGNLRTQTKLLGFALLGTAL